MKIPAFAMLISLGLLGIANASEVILEDDFTTGTSGGVAGRSPAVGNLWDGLAQVSVGTGLVHGGQALNHSAVAELEAPKKNKEISFLIEGIWGIGGQFAFGFTNDPRNIRGDNSNNRGLIWAGISGGKVKIFAGEYANGDTVEAKLPGLQDGKPFSMKLTAKKVPGDTPVPVTFTFNGKQFLDDMVLPTKTPSYKYFFVQFREADGVVNTSIVHSVRIEIQ